jgi:DNA-binding CsgD family transcriptional regulator
MSVVLEFLPKPLGVDRFALERLLDLIALPLFLVTARRALVYANAAGETEMALAETVGLRAGGLRLHGSPAQLVRFEQAIMAAADPATSASTTMTVGGGGQPMVSVTVLAFAGPRSMAPLAAVILTAQEDCAARVTLRLQEGLELTPAEARVAFYIYAGKRAKEIARHLKVSINTVKSQLANVLAKTGCSDQAAFCVLAQQMLTPVRLV